MKGFTLIEIIVAVGVFSIILLISAGIFSGYTDNQRRAIDTQDLQESVRLSLEVMSRELRTAYGESFVLANNALTFRNQNGNCVQYSLGEDKIMRSETENSDTDCDIASFSSSAESLTGKDIVVNALAFKPWPSFVEDENLLSQGFVTIVLQASTVDEQKTLNVQTTVASRQVAPWSLGE